MRVILRDRFTASDRILCSCAAAGWLFAAVTCESKGIVHIIFFFMNLSVFLGFFRFVAEKSNCSMGTIKDQNSHTADQARFLNEVMPNSKKSRLAIFGSQEKTPTFIVEFLIIRSIPLKPSTPDRRSFTNKHHP